MGLSDLEWTSLTQELLAGSERTGVKLGLSDGQHQLELSQIAASLHHWTAVRIRKKNIRSEPDSILSQVFPRSSCPKKKTSEAAKVSQEMSLC